MAKLGLTTRCAMVSAITLAVLIQPAEGQDSDQAIELPELSVWGGYSRALVHLEKGQADKALPLLEKHASKETCRPLHRIYFARALGATGAAERALAVLAELREDVDLAAAVAMEIASIHASQKDFELAADALGCAIELEYTPTRAQLASDRRWKRAIKDSKIKRLLRQVTTPRERLSQLHEIEDQEQIEALWRALRTHWRGEDFAPVYILQSVIDEFLREGSDKQAERLLAEARAGALAADRVFGNERFTRWVNAMAQLDKSQRKQYFANWKQLRKSPSLFRSHRFKQIVGTYGTVQRSCREQGDKVGEMCAAAVIGLGRYCLVEYKTAGFDLRQQWRQSWECYRQVHELASDFGDIEEEAGALGNFLYLLHHPVDDKTKAMARSQLTPALFLAAIESEARLPKPDRDTDWYVRALKWK